MCTNKYTKALIMWLYYVDGVGVDHSFLVKIKQILTR